MDMEKAEGWNDEPIKPEQMHAAGSFKETQSDEIPDSPEAAAIRAEAEQARNERNAEHMAEAEEQAKKLKAAM